MDYTAERGVEKWPSLDEQFDALANAERRRLLVALFEAHERDETPIRIDEGEAEGRPVRMVHHHLPKLEDRGFVSWEQSELLVTEGPHFREIEPLLEHLAERIDHPSASD